MFRKFGTLNPLADSRRPDDVHDASEESFLAARGRRRSQGGAQRGRGSLHKDRSINTGIIVAFPRGSERQAIKIEFRLRDAAPD